MTNIYFISGIGADKRLFKYIRLPKNFNAVYVDWTAPEKNETLSDYAVRLSLQIDTHRPFMLVGLSLGGLISVEIAKRFAPTATILIGSVPVSEHMPRYFAFARFLRLAKYLPVSFFKRTAMLKRLFTREKADDKKLLLQIIREADSRFIKWALNAVLHWQNSQMPEPLWQIHGTRDEVFPIWLTRPSHTISKGGHMLVMTHADEVNRILGNILRGY
jgi:pimeloyl-ACP methyl ester carboxylesterase